MLSPADGQQAGDRAVTPLVTHGGAHCFFWLSSRAGNRFSSKQAHSYRRMWSQLKNHADLKNSPLFALTLKTNTSVVCFVLFVLMTLT